MIPPELYTVVAEILVFVDKTDKLRGRYMAEYNKRAVGSMYEDMAVKYLVSQDTLLLRETIEHLMVR